MYVSRAAFSINWSAPVARYKVNLSTTGWRVEIIWQRPHVGIKVHGHVRLAAVGTYTHTYTHTHAHTHTPTPRIERPRWHCTIQYNVKTILRRSTCHGESPDLFAPFYRRLEKINKFTLVFVHILITRSGQRGVMVTFFA